MGQIAQAAQSRQLAQMNPKQNMLNLLEKSWPRIAAVIGNSLSPQRLYQMYVSTINREPALAQCTVESVLSCFMKCAALGLEPSNVDGLGRAYVLPFGNKNMRTGQREATLIIGYKGMIDLARRSGQIRDISARAVHEGDDFSYRYGLDEDLRHVPCAKPGRLTHVYMIANFKDGGHYFLVMTADEIEQAMRRSPSARKQTSPWHTDYEAMAKKTVIRRAFPYLPVSVEAQTAAASDDATPDYSDVFHPLPDEPADETPVEATVEEPEPEPEQPAADDPRERILAAFRTLGVADEAEVCATISKIIGRQVESLDGLSDEELDKVVADIAGGTKRKDGE